MGVSNRVTHWADVLEQAVADVGAEVDLGTMLALVATESSGDPHADNGTFKGLLQVGGPYLIDAREWLERHRPHLLKEVPTKKGGLLGEPRASALVVAAYLRRYEMRHDWDPYRVAAIHKGGAGTAKTLSRKLAAGLDLETALEETERERRVPNLELYVLGRRHFAGHLRDYSAWASEREDALYAEEEAARVEAMADEVPVCEPADEDPVELIGRALRMLAAREASS